VTLQRGRLPTPAANAQGGMLEDTDTGFRLQQAPREGVLLERCYRYARGLNAQRGRCLVDRSPEICRPERGPKRTEIRFPRMMLGDDDSEDVPPGSVLSFRWVINSRYKGHSWNGWPLMLVRAPVHKSNRSARAVLALRDGRASRRR
jgi:hypothetical protein